jgi:hypothetical protein
VPGLFVGNLFVSVNLAALNSLTFGVKTQDVIWIDLES